MKTLDLPLAAETTRFVVPWVLLAGLTAGTLELAFSSLYWAFHGVPPSRILQVIGGWILGRDAALAGGYASVLVGAALHYSLMTAMAAGYALAGRRLPVLLKQPLRYGALYGACMYALMFMVLVPMLSASRPLATLEPLDWRIACFVAYVALVGIPCALFAKVVRRD